MKLLPRLSAVILAAAGTTPAHSSTAYQGELQDIHFMSNGVVLVTTTGSRTTAPACSSVAGRFAFDSTTPAGRSQLAGLIAAEAADRLACSSAQVTAVPMPTARPSNISTSWANP